MTAACFAAPFCGASFVRLIGYDGGNQWVAQLRISMRADREPWPPQHLTWMQICLRFLSVVMLSPTVLNTICDVDVIARRIPEVKRQRKTVETIQRFGGDAFYDGDFDDQRRSPQRIASFSGRELLENVARADFVDRNGQDLRRGGPNVQIPSKKEFLTDDDLRSLTRSPAFARLPGLRICSSHITDDGLECLSSMLQLEVLYLNDKQITDLGVRHLARLKGLRFLDLEGTQITDAAIPYLKLLGRLRNLNLTSTPITDTGVSYLKLLPQLHELRLGRTQITDAGIANLQSLPQLRDLWLECANITDAGAASLGELMQL